MKEVVSNACINNILNHSEQWMNLWDGAGMRSAFVMRWGIIATDRRQHQQQQQLASF